MSSTAPTHLLRVSGCLLAGIAFLALGTDVSFAKHHHHHSGKSGAVASDAKTVVPSVSTPTNLVHSPAPGIGAKGGAKTGAGAANPIDLSITVQPGRWSKKIYKPADAKKTMRAGPTENFHKHKETLAPDAKVGPARNAVGVLGGSVGSTHTGPAIDLTAKNAVGGGAETDASAAGTGLSHQGPGVGPSHLAPSTVSHQGFGAVGAGTSNAVVSGNVVRAGAGPGSVGGAAKNMASINGTTVRPRRCLGGC
jgi:hypothetical protein